MNNRKLPDAHDFPPSFTMETYDRYGRLQKIEMLRTMTYEEFKFELERAELARADVLELSDREWYAALYDAGKYVTETPRGFTGLWTVDDWIYWINEHGEWIV